MTLKERSASHSHFIDLCRLLDQPTPTEADPTGDFYTFEKGAEKTAGPTGGDHGWADVWKKGHFAWEYKGPRANLEAAYEQLLQYRESLENPPLLVVSDLQTIEVHTNFTNSVKRITTFTLDDLLDPDKLDQLRRVWTDPFAFRAAETPENVTEQAARKFARLAEILRQRGEDPDRAAHFLIRLLFCLFAEDVRLLPEKLFSKLVAATRTNPEAFSAQLRQLFGAMRDGGFFGFEQVPRFDGGLFDDEVLTLDREGLDVLHRVGRLDWDSIEPSILGTLYVLALHTGMRRGELLGLKWDDVDLDSATVRVRRTLMRTDNGRRLALADPKTKKSRRTVRLTQRAVEALRSHRATQAKEKLRVVICTRIRALCLRARAAALSTLPTSASDPSHHS